MMNEKGGWIVEKVPKHDVEMTKCDDRSDGGSQQNKDLE